MNTRPAPLFALSTKRVDAGMQPMPEAPAKPVWLRLRDGGMSAVMLVLVLAVQVAFIVAAW